MGALVLGGCGGSGAMVKPGKDAAETAKAATSKPVKGIQNAPVEKPKASMTTLSAKTLSVEVANVLTYDGDDGKSYVVVRDNPPNCHCAGKAWWVRYYTGSEQAGKADQEAKFTIDPSGYVAITERIDRVEKVEVVFTPALVVMPDGLPPVAWSNSNYAQDLKMTVHPLGDRSKVKSSGAVRNEILYIGDEQVTTPAGTFTARRVLSTFTADLGPAKVTNQTEQWFADGVGIVTEREQERTKVLGVQVRDNSGMKLLRQFEKR